MIAAPTSEIELANCALDVLGQSPINSISPPGDDIESLVSRNFSRVRQAVLCKYTVWNFAKAESSIPIAYTNVVSSTSTQPAAISAITQANPGAITSAAHGFTTGQQVTITGVVGMTQLNGQTYTVTVIDVNTLNLIFNGANVNTVGFGAYVSGGVITPTNVIPLITNLVQDYADFYALPSKCLKLLSVGGDIEIDQNKYDYDLRHHAGQMLLCLNNNEQPTINVRYIRDITDFSQWEAPAREVFILELAAKLAFPITKDPKIVQMVEGQLRAEIPDAKAADGQENPPKRIQRSRVLDARQIGVDADPRYYFPRSYGY